jgi:hypothetical protein
MIKIKERKLKPASVYTTLVIYSYSLTISVRWGVAMISARTHVHVADEYTQTVGIVHGIITISNGHNAHSVLFSRVIPLTTMMW